MNTYKKTLETLYFDSDGNLNFGFKNNVPSSAKGINVLLQNIVIRLFTELGSNTFEEDAGTNLQTILGFGYNEKEIENFKMEFINLFNNIENQIKTEQANNYASLPYSQRLVKLNLISLEYVEKDQAFEMTLNVVTESGTEYTFNVVT